ncbi:Clp protease N-terminal domain-containing protein [Nocardia jinanensis]|uniref:Clp protease n=1 Tax=Nocardia jinanensis TaxID=382504 RepID=A0A917RXT1_9NOCA|nr:Clp protease N-terminal domain-containing protein [Nocardia jinanensis]GGL43425.1 Clp protease [Nocardia jinanensis]
MFERFAGNARMAVVAAQEQARELRSPEIRVEHLLLGLLQQAEPRLRTLLAQNGLTERNALRSLGTAGEDEPLGAGDAEALRSIGIDLDAVRESLEANFGADALNRAVPSDESWGLRGRRRGGRFGHIPFTRGAKKVLELSLREALARREKTIETGHVLLGILRAPGPVAAELLGGSEGITRLRGEVHTFLDKAA